MTTKEYVLIGLMVIAGILLVIIWKRAREQESEKK